jgi:uncharacterized membrane protein (DUF485 family)
MTFSRVTQRFLFKVWTALAPGVKSIAKILLFFFAPIILFSYGWSWLGVDVPENVIFGILLWAFGVFLFQVGGVIYKYVTKTWKEAKAEISYENKKILRAFED